MAERALVIRTAGDARLAGAIADGMAAKELAKLRAEIGVRQARDARYWADKIAEADRKYGAAPARLTLWERAVLFFLTAREILHA